MRAINVEFSVIVQATADELWDILTAVESWRQWQGTRFVKLTEPGPIREGSIFSVELAGLKWHVRVMKAERPHKIVWAGRRAGLKAVHEWEFNEIDGKTTVTTRESMAGWLLLVAHHTVRKTLSGTDEKWLADLKTRAESM